MGEKILEICTQKGIATTLMKVNPVGTYSAYNARLDEAKKRGNPSPELTLMVDRMKKRVDLCQDFIKKHHLTNNEEIKKAAYRFVLSNPHVNCALYNFNSFEDVDSLLSVSGTKLTGVEQTKLHHLASACDKLYCRHACGSCESKCPEGVPVNTILRYNYYFETLKQEKYAMTRYAELNTPKADKCMDCSGHCRVHCPHGVEAQGLLILAHQNLSLG